MTETTNETTVSTANEMTSAEAMDTLKKHPVSNRIISFALGIIAALGAMHLVPEDVHKAAVHQQEEWRAERMAMLSDIRNITQRIVQSPEVPVNYIALTDRLNYFTQMSDAEVMLWRDEVENYLTDAQIEKIELNVCHKRDKMVEEMKEMFTPHPEITKKWHLKVLKDRETAMAYFAIQRDKLNLPYGEFISPDPDKATYAEINEYLFQMKPIIEQEASLIDAIKNNIAGLEKILADHAAQEALQDTEEVP